MIALGDVVIIGGGCYGSFYAGQLAKARAKGASRGDACSWSIATRRAHVDRSARRPSPMPTLVVSEWGAFLDAWLDDATRPTTTRSFPRR